MLESWLLPDSYRVIQLEKIAKTTQFSFTTKDEFGLINLLKDFQFIKKGTGEKIVNILRDKTTLYESDFYVFDCQYTISDGDNALNFPQTVFFAQSKQLALPPFSIRPAHFLNRINNYLGVEDIYPEAFPPFSEQYWLNGEERKIHESMSDELLHFFTTEKDWNVEGLNYFMIFYKKNRILPTTEILDFYQKGRGLMELFSNPQNI